MSDISDRLPFLNGSTGLARQFCEYPAPHSDLTRGSDHETGSISAQTDDFSDLFDWDRYASDNVTDVTTQSDVPSERSPAAALSALRGAGSAVTVPSIEEDCPMPDVGSHEPHPPDVWPMVQGPHPPRDVNIRLEGSPSPPLLTESMSGSSSSGASPGAPEMHPGGQTHPVPAQSHKKTRIVKFPEETNQVRDLKACYHCKMNKSRCGSALVCEACTKRPFPELGCIRRPPREILASLFSRWNWIDPSSKTPTREQFDVVPIPIFISLSSDIESPCLPVNVRSFMVPSPNDQRNQGIPRWGIIADERPPESFIFQWMEQQIQFETGLDFETQMDKLLLRFVCGKYTPSEQPLATLLANILKMRCMWKVWSCKQLYHREQLGVVPGTEFDFRFASIQDSLRLYAAQAISELERKVIGDIDALILNKKDAGRVPQPKRCRLDIAKWLLLWQVILIYRQSLSWMLQQQQTNHAAPIPILVVPMGERRHKFRETTIHLLNAMVVIYSEVFHKNTTVEGIRDGGASVFGDDCQTLKVFQAAWKALPEFYEQVMRQISPADELFKALIVRKEAEVLAKGRHTRR
ncbi:hypothetical protein VTK26DRAFT_8527 [Humicola hyalothermophila]